MKTKSMFKALWLIVFLAMASPVVSYASETRPVAAETDAQRADRLQKRLEEIKAMDTEKLSKGEKKALRVEVRNIKKELKAISGGVYLSVGAILLILLLIILLA